MKKVILLQLFLFVIFNVQAQDLTISFQPKVSGTPIDSIRATNLRTNQTVKLTGNETLLLVKPTGINPVITNSEAGYVFPNPTNKDATLSFSTSKSQLVEVSLFNIAGQLLGQQKQSITQGMHHYLLKFPVAGIYYVSVNKSDGNESFKVVYTGYKTQSSSIDYAGYENFKTQGDDVNYLKSAISGKTLTYKDGDVIHYAFSSGKNTSILTDIPTSSKALNVEFVECIDKDNRSYKVVKIGSQWWMAENLQTTKYSDGTIIPNLIDNVEWINSKNGAYRWYNNDETTYKKFGALYNWYAVNTGKLSPKGWHVPSNVEWSTLISFLGEGAGGKMKEVLSDQWSSPNVGATNESGFSALPGGCIDFTYALIDKIGEAGAWWTSSNYQTAYANMYYLLYNDAGVYQYTKILNDAFSVRCIRYSDGIAPTADFLASATSIIKGQTVVFTDKSTNDPTSWLWEFGDGTQSTEQNPSKKYNTVGTFTVTLNTTNSFGLSTKTLNNLIIVTNPGFTGQFGTLDYAGKTYKTIIIAGKEWMAENLAYLPSVSSPSDGSQTAPFYYVYGYSGTDVASAKATANYTNYGVLYNLPAAKVACPPGWHLPTDDEWKQLEIALGMTKAQSDADGWRGTDEGMKMKSISGWNLNGDGTNTSGFSALPAGSRLINGKFGGIGEYCSWWSSSMHNYNYWRRTLSSYNYNVGRNDDTAVSGLSVRCVKD